jgi:DHA1 family tetracycline resistance protein-like MFS transporter
MDNKRLVTIFVIVFVDLLGFSLILPLLPYYANTFGANDFTIGLLVASYAAAQLLGAPLLGRLSDRFGRRPILLLSIFGTFIGFLLLGFARSLWMLFASRILDGLTGGNISVAQAYIADVTDEKNRAKSFGLIGAAFGLGFIIGPAAGGLLSAGERYAVPAFVAAVLSVVNLIMVYFLLPESLDKSRMAANAARPAMTFTALWQALNKPRVGPLLHTRFFFGVAFAMFQTIFSQYAQRLGLNVQTTGFVLTYVGLLSVITQGFAIGRLTRRFSEVNLMVAGAAIMGLSLFAWAFTPNVWVLLIVLTPIAFSGGVLNTVLTSALSKSVYPEEVGGTLGLATSVESLTRVIAPSLGGFLLGAIGIWAPGVFSGLVMLWVLSFIYRRLLLNPDPPLPPRPNTPGLHPSA